MERRRTKKELSTSDALAEIAVMGGLETLVIGYLDGAFGNEVVKTFPFEGQQPIVSIITDHLSKVFMHDATLVSVNGNAGGVYCFADLATKAPSLINGTSACLTSGNVSLNGIHLIANALPDGVHIALKSANLVVNGSPTINNTVPGTLLASGGNVSAIDLAKSSVTVGFSAPESLLLFGIEVAAIVAVAIGSYYLISHYGDSAKNGVSEAVRNLYRRSVPVKNRVSVLLRGESI